MVKMDLVQGTLDMLILRVLERGRTHGWGIAQRIRQVSRDVLTVEEGSLYPALYRMERKGWIEWEWGHSENNRRAKYSRLTSAGRQGLGLEKVWWARMCVATDLVMESA